MKNSFKFYWKDIILLFTGIGNSDIKKSNKSCYDLHSI